MTEPRRDRLHLTRACTRPDERFTSLQGLAHRIHALRAGRAITVRTGFLPRNVVPRGACVTVRLAETGEVLGHAFLRGEETDAERLRLALAAACPDTGARAEAA